MRLDSLEIDEKQENQEILRRYRRLLRSARPLLHDGDEALIREAFMTAVNAHRGTRRKSGEPYIYHPIAVAQIAAEEIGLGTTSIIAALLHDVVEDTEIELSELERRFGPKVAKIIDGLTKISGVFQTGTSQQAENFRKMLLTLSDDVRVILIKLADRLHNMRTLEAMPRNTQLKIANETIYLYAPLAHRLGLYAIKTELEDLYLKYTETEVYKEIAQKLAQSRTARNRFIKEFIGPLEAEIKKAGFNVTIKGRPKSIYSIFSKMRKQKVPFEDIYDLFAIRIIIDTTPENEKPACWQVYSIVTDFYKPNPDRLRDWISTPRSNGYESLHTTVMSKTGQWVEVQIRTMRMDEIAEKGYAAHWKYKDATTSSARENGLEQWITRVREMLERPGTSAVEFVNEFRNNLFNEEVYVFTPNGDLKILPAGATALDFAFEIHSQVGAHCLGAKVNNKLVPISYKIKNGDQIEILTSSKQKPSEDWLKIVATSKAVAKIKDHLRDERKKVAVDGKEIAERKLKALKLDMNEELLAELRAYFNQKSNLDLYFSLGKGIIDPAELKRFKEFKEAKAEGPALPPAKHLQASISKTLKGAESDVISIGDDLERVEYSLAKCCNPIRGDEVFGFVTINEGIKIHRTSCPNAPEMMANYGYRIIKVRWTAQVETAFLTGLRIAGTDRIGLINDVTKVISSELKVNMRSITIDTHDGVFDGKIMLYVSDTSHLDKLISKLKKVSGVVGISRFEN